MDALQTIQNYGFPTPLDNAEVKPFVIYDQQTLAATEYQFFNAPIQAFVRNKQFPLSGSEVYFINKIRLDYSRETSGATLAAFAELMLLSFLEIFVDDKQYLKIPLVEIYNNMNSDAYFNVGHTATGLKNGWYNASKKLINPIMINSQSNVNIRLSTTATVAGAYAGSFLRLSLYGYKYDKITPVIYDAIKNNQFQRLDYTIYNVVNSADAATNFNLFSNRGAAFNTFSKNFPLSDTEAFSLESIETVVFSINDANLANDQAAQIVYNEISPSTYNITVNDNEIFAGTLPESYTMFIYKSRTITDSGADTISWLNNQYVKGGAVFNKTNNDIIPVTIPAASGVNFTFSKPATTRITDLIGVLLKGQLIRRVL